MSAALFVVGTPKQVEAVARGGGRAETRASFFRRVFSQMVPGVTLLDGLEARWLLGFALERGEGAAAVGQLSLFGGAAPSPASGGSDPLARVRASGPL
ncbi:MAG: hypothetical protein KC657_21700, partial [Myxococcales bacterium]|nr:hypothetical protein [Myxococcales bacterium]